MLAENGPKLGTGFLAAFDQTGVLNRNRLNRQDTQMLDPAEHDFNAPRTAKQTWRVGALFDDRLNGYPITRDGMLVAIAVYSGGTEPARKNAEQIVAALNR